MHLRPFRDTDEPALRLVLEDARTRLWNPLSSSDLGAWIAQVNAETGESPTWAVADDEDDRLLGTVSVFHIDREQGTGEVGYRVAPAERRHGVATAAVREAARRLFDEGLRRLELYHAIENPASCRVAERAGFRLEGTLRQSYVYGDGRAYDEHLHARLATDVRE